MIIWLGLLLSGVVFAAIGTLTLAKLPLIGGAITLCCFVSLLTPTLIELSEGEQWLYFVLLAIFVFYVGALQLFLFIYLTNEMEVRDSMQGQP